MIGIRCSLQLKRVSNDEVRHSVNIDRAMFIYDPFSVKFDR